MKKNNPVAKYQRRFNQAKVYEDKEQRCKRGYQKHTIHSKKENPLPTNCLKQLVGRGFCIRGIYA